MERRMYGTGSITAKGYVRTNGDMVHRRVWRKHHGPVPTGFFVHHIDGNKQNNDIANLELVDALSHKRIHSGCELRDGEWWKPCRKCGELKRVSTDYTNESQELVPGVSRVVSEMLSTISDGANWNPTTNIHSTVKPTSLMRYLGRLVTPHRLGSVLS